MNINRRAAALSALTLFFVLISVLFSFFIEETGRHQGHVKGSHNIRPGPDRVTSIGSIPRKEQAKKRSDVNLEERANLQVLETYIGRVVDEQGIPIANCKVYLSDDEDRFFINRPSIEVRFERQKEEGLYEDEESEDSDEVFANDENSALTFEGQTDIDGRFAIPGVKQSDFDNEPFLKIDPPEGFKARLFQLSLPKNKNYGEFILKKTGRISGTLFSNQDQTISEAPVILVRASFVKEYGLDLDVHPNVPWPNQLTDKLGHFEFSNVESGDYYLLTKTATSRLSSAFVSVFPSCDTLQNIFLTPGRSIKVRVIDSKGHAIPNAVITLDSTDPWYLFNDVKDKYGYDYARQALKGISDRRGVCELGQVFERQALLTINAPGFLEMRQRLELAESEQERVIPVVLSSPCIVSGHIIDADDKPLACTVDVHRLDIDGCETRPFIHKGSDVNGRFELPPLAPGQYRLSVLRNRPLMYLYELQRYTIMLTVPNNREWFSLGQIKMKRACTVQLTIMSSSGQPLSNVRVEATQNDVEHGFIASTPVSDKDGKVSLAGFIPGTAEVIMNVKNELIGFCTITIPDRENSEHELIIKEFGQLKARLINHLGHPVTRGKVLAFTSGANKYLMNVEDGPYPRKEGLCLLDLPPGPINLVFSSSEMDDDDWTDLGQVIIHSGETTEVTFSLPAPK